MSGRLSDANTSPDRRFTVDFECALNRSRLWNRATWLLLCAACRPDAPSVPPISTAASIAVIGGDRQHADPNDALGEPIKFKVMDDAGRSVAGVRIDFTVPVGGGSVSAPSVITDSLGHAEISWTMGPFGGVQELEALVNGKLMATATASTCEPTECFPPSQVAGTLSDATLLSLATYELSGQTVHPDVVRAHGTATGFWLAITPYPASNILFENPSIFRSKDATTWVVPKGATNPLVQAESPTYLSDPDLVVDGDNTLWMYYRSVSSGQNIISVIRSSDGVHWGTAVAVITVPGHQLVSPTVVRGAPNARWQMWAVNAGVRGCSTPLTTIERRTSSDGIHWSDAAAIDLVQPGQSIWHIDVQWIAARSEYWALYNTYPSGTSCTTNALYLARSPDGIKWSVYPSPIARSGVIRAFKHLIYRSTFMTTPRAGHVTLWMSGAEFVNGAYVWGTASVTTKVADLLAIASSPATLLRAAPFSGKLPPPEPDVSSH